MSEKRKISTNKPPVPARPKNLVVFNSKHLPKPPETFSSESVTNFIRDLNLDIQDEGSETLSKKEKQIDQNKYDNTFNSDGEEDMYGYLEPVALPVDANANKKGVSMNFSHKKSIQEDPCKLGDIFQKIMRNSSGEYTMQWWEDAWFYIGVGKAIIGNLCGRLSNEMAELGFRFKRKLVNSVKMSGKSLIDREFRDSNSESLETEGSRPTTTQNQWQRPLPLPPVDSKKEIICKPWYKNVDRKKGEEILKNGIDGYFLVRPSSNADAYLTLTLWYCNRVYNIPIRRRKDGKFALGTPKTNEQCFDTVEYMIKNYQSEKLVLFSKGVQSGKTLLTAFPP